MIVIVMGVDIEAEQAEGLPKLFLVTAKFQDGQEKVTVIENPIL